LAWVLCFQTKQAFLPVAVVLLCADWRHRRRIVVGLGTFAVALGASMAWMNRTTHGWYSFYLFHIAGGFGIVWRKVYLYGPENILAPMGIALLLAVAAWAFTRVSLLSPAGSFYAAVTVALFGAVGYVAAHAGASSNAYMPIYAWTAVLFGVALDRLLRHLEQSKDARAALATMIVLLAAATQLAMLLYNPGQYIPQPAVRAARQRFIDQAHSLPGDIYIFSHSYDALLAGKQPHAEAEAIGAVLALPNNPIAKNLRAEFDNAIGSHRYGGVIVDGSLSSEPYHFQRGYPYALSAESEDSRYLTSQPTWILLPCETASTIAPMAIREDTDIRPEHCPTVQP